MSAESARSGRNIVLIGMPASGKTTIGRRVANQMGRPFYDSDAEIEAREGRTCAMIINEDGEATFRAIEREVIAELVSKRGIVLSVGGGAPMTCGDLLRRNSVVVLLERSIEATLSSFESATRPLSRSRDDFERLLAERSETYKQLFEFYEANDNSPQLVAARLVNNLTVALYARILVINGPNLNLLGTREPSIYGAQTYDDLVAYVQNASLERKVFASFYQSNHEGEIIDKLHAARDYYDGIIINPAAYTHYSYAILDALKAINLPAVEVHLSDISTREEFRRHSVTAAACVAQVSGEGFAGYVRAMDILLSEKFES